tara:strand:- start:27 stop:362 length:336 start_codon:yes stop_codon:yes gene_type:complete
MSLGTQQKQFMRKLPRLLDKIFELGYEITGGDLMRDARTNGEFGEKVGYSSADSYHKLKLAIDLNIFKDGVWLTSTEDHRPIGEWWVSQGGTWGGNFKSPDGNHYSWGESK